jgi:acetyl esterase/lipase
MRTLQLPLNWMSAVVFCVALASLPTTASPRQDQLMKPGELEKLPARPPDHRLSYGADASQVGELRVPSGPGPHPVAVLIHGGCWRAEFATLQDLPAMADALKEAGIASWNIEYRRLGQPSAGWPGTYQDVGRGIDHLRGIARAHRLDLSKVVVVGHSAGGHLAMWSATRSQIGADSALFVPNPLPIRGVVNLAGTIDMTRNIERMEAACRAPVVTQMLGGTTDTVGSRYREVSATALLPLRVRQVLVWGQYEDFVPLALAEAHVSAAKAAGDPARLVVIPAAGHFELANPSSGAWPPVLEAIRSVLAD